MQIHVKPSALHFIEMLKAIEGDGRHNGHEHKVYYALSYPSSCRSQITTHIPPYTVKHFLVQYFHHLLVGFGCYTCTPHALSEATTFTETDTSIQVNLTWIFH